MKNKKLKDSFANAFHGLKLAFSRERNMRIHIIAALLAVILGVVFRLDTLSWAILMVAIGLVFAAELLNTAIENMVDMVTAEYSEKAKAVKDIAAGAVLTVSAVAVFLGILVFIGPFIKLITTLFWN